MVNREKLRTSFLLIKVFSSQLVFKDKSGLLSMDVGDYNDANMIHDFFVEAGEKLGMIVDEPHWIEVYPARCSPQTFEQYIN